MTSRWKQREFKRQSTWRQSLLFNSLLLILPIMAARIIIGAYTSDIATDPLSQEARMETLQEIESSFRGLSGTETIARDVWARKIESTLAERDFSAARGYLLAAPYMLNRQDAQAVLAAAEAEQSGTQDQRLTRAALLFLPDAVRARYERAITPPRLAMTVPVATDEAEPETASENTEEAAAETPPQAETTPENAQTVDPFNSRKAFRMLGDPKDLTRRSERWLAGENIDSLELRLSALGLIKQAEERDESIAFANAASVLRAAHRSGRLNERFSDYLISRIEAAVPEQELRTNLAAVFEPVLTTRERSDALLTAYSATINEEGLGRLNRDLTIVARLVELTGTSGALTLVEQASTPEDMRRALLITEAGGERSVALARELGPSVLGLAQIGAQWTRLLVFQVMGLMGLGMALIWTTMSVFTQAETVRVRSR
ncbi:MAG: hypothetical protein QNI84_05290 [Henriciella sp.]|nr:hypothetical protein [Henriciella sp.]